MDPEIQSMLDGVDDPEIRDAIVRLASIRHIVGTANRTLRHLDYAMWRNDEPAMRLALTEVPRMIRMVAQLGGLEHLREVPPYHPRPDDRTKRVHFVRACAAGIAGWPRITRSEARMLLRRLEHRRRVRTLCMVLFDVLFESLHQLRDHLVSWYRLAYRHLGGPDPLSLPLGIRNQYTPVLTYLGIPLHEIQWEILWDEDPHMALHLLRRVIPGPMPSQDQQAAPPLQDCAHGQLL